MGTKLWLVPLVKNFFSWRCPDPKINRHGLTYHEHMPIDFQVMRVTGKKVIDPRHKKSEIMKKWKTGFCKMAGLIVVLVPSCQNNSWWEWVGGPESVGKSRKVEKRPRTEKNDKFRFSANCQLCQLFSTDSGSTTHYHQLLFPWSSAMTTISMSNESCLMSQKSWVMKSWVMKSWIMFFVWIL